MEQPVFRRPHVPLSHLCRSVLPKATSRGLLACKSVFNKHIHSTYHTDTRLSSLQGLTRSVLTRTHSVRTSSRCMIQVRKCQRSQRYHARSGLRHSFPKTGYKCPPGPSARCTNATQPADLTCLWTNTERRYQQSWTVMRKIIIRCC